MNKDQLQKLLDAYLKGDASSTERKLLDEFYHSYQNELNDQTGGEEKDVRDDILRLAKSRIEGKRPHMGISGGPRTWLLVAASVTIVLVSTVAFYLSQQSSEKENVSLANGTEITRTTQRGLKLSIKLPDGSSVKLNSSSQISFPSTFEGNTREVTIRGEAYFDVVHDDTKPFIVHSGNTSTRVLGTSFNVKENQGKGFQITLVQGKVNVTAEGISNGVDLIPNQQANIDLGSTEITTKNVDAERFVCWKDNRIYFEETPLIEAAKILEDWYNVTIEIKNEKLASCKISGEYKNSSLENILKSLQYMFTSKIIVGPNNHIIIDGKECNSQGQTNSTP